MLSAKEVNLGVNDLAATSSLACAAAMQLNKA